MYTFLFIEGSFKLNSLSKFGSSEHNSFSENDNVSYTPLFDDVTRNEDTKDADASSHGNDNNSSTPSWLLQEFEEAEV